jgi:hypothetical protein
MRRPDRASRFLQAASLIALTSSLYAADTNASSDKKSASVAKAAPADAQMIKSAMSAAPAKIAKAATIVAMDADGKMLRAGTNGFTCMPDNPATPGPDPMCMDKNATEWIVSARRSPSGKNGEQLRQMRQHWASVIRPNPTAWLAICARAA